MWIVLIMLFVLVSSLKEIQSVQNDYSTSGVAWFITLTTPRMAYQVFPIAALLGVLVGVGNLAASNELVAFRTSGVSRFRLAVAALLGALTLTAPVMVLGEWVAPEAEQAARTFRIGKLMGRAVLGGQQGVWLRDNHEFVNIKKPLLSMRGGESVITFREIVIYGLSEKGQLETVTRADRAIHEGDTWVLKGVTTVSLGGEGASMETREEKLWGTTIRPELMDSAITRPALLSLRSLARYLDYLSANSLDERAYLEAFWEKVMFPFTTAALVLVAMPFVFVSGKAGNLGVRLFLGMILGGFFIVLDNLAQQFGNVYGISAFLTNALPSFLLIVGSVLVLRRSL